MEILFKREGGWPIQGIGEGGGVNGEKLDISISFLHQLGEEKRERGTEGKGFNKYQTKVSTGLYFHISKEFL